MQPIRYVFNLRLVAEVDFENSFSRMIFNDLIHGYLRLCSAQHAKHNLIAMFLSNLYFKSPLYFNLKYRTQS